MAINSVNLSSIPEVVVKAAETALGKDVTSAAQVGDGVMFGGNKSYEDDDWVKITYDAEGVISKIVKPHPFSDESEEDITSEILNQLKDEEDQSTASVKSRLRKVNAWLNRKR